MVSTIESDKNSLEIIKECINAKKSFVLEAGAGSGKTWTLVETVKYVIKLSEKELVKNHQKIVCITYTNVAKNEIIERTYHSDIIQVSTIHEFLWESIKNYQIELKKALCELNQASISDLEKQIAFTKIEYRNYRDIKAGIISHDDVIKIANILFHKYNKLKKIVCDKHPYIFIDEYQDTQKEIINILINSLLTYRIKKHDFMLGFYGDTMQKIYNTGIGNLEPFIPEEIELIKINKIENYRCSKAVINLLNKIRVDLIQLPTGNNNEGEVKLLYVPSGKEGVDVSTEKIIAKLDWGKNEKETNKILFLTHKKIAQTANFINLYNVFSKRYKGFINDKLNGKEDKIIEFMIDSIEEMVALYEKCLFEDFWKLCTYPVKSRKDKTDLNNIMKKLIEMRKNNKIYDVINFVNTKGLLRKPEKISYYENNLDVIEQKEVEFYSALMELEYKEVMGFNQYLKEESLFSTKHGVKGAEFDNVLVVIDDTAWNQYSFKDIFCNNIQSTKYKRTLNLLYVCCSRSKNNLALLLLSSIGEDGIANAKEWFGKNNVIEYSI